MSWDRQRLRALEELRMLERLLEEPSESDARVTEGYLDTKRVLAEAFRARALDRYGSSKALQGTVALVENGIQETFPHLLEKYRRVHGYGLVHASLLAYLTDRVGLNVSADELRILTCDAVHTERRARDLRDLGFALLASKSSGLQAYCLVDEVPDVALGVRLTVARNIRNDRRIDKGTRNRLFLSLGLPVDS